MKSKLIVAALIVMLGLVVGAALAQSGNELFSQALSKERTESNMAEAIKLYQTIVEKYPRDRNLVAKALLQIGLSYEKLGNSAEARKAFDRVLREYRDQKEPTTEAAARLAEFDRARFAGQGGVIRGRVTDRGQPALNAQVFALKAAYHDGQRVMTTVLHTTTNLLGEYNLGQYNFSQLRPGKYYVAAVVLANTAGNGGADYGMHVPIYFPGTPDWQKAKVIEVRSGTAVPSVNIDAAPLPVRRVRGTVTGITPFEGAFRDISAVLPARGQPVRAPLVTLMWRDLPFPVVNLPPAVMMPVLDSGGAFAFPRITPGSYVLYASQIGGNGGRVEIEVRDRDVDGVNIAMAPGLTVSGRITPPTTGVLIVLRMDPPVRGANRYIAMPMPDGSFNIATDRDSRPLQSGNYRVSVEPILVRPTVPEGVPPPVGLPERPLPTTPQAPENAYVKSIRLGEADVLNDGLHLRAQPQQELLIVIGANPGTLEGRVVNDRREPVAASAVVLIPEGGIRFRVDHKFTATDASGRFRIQGIPPGDYKILAWQGIENGEWQDPDFVRPHESRGKLVHIKEGDRQVNVEVVGIPPKP